MYLVVINKGILFKMMFDKIRGPIEKYEKIVEVYYIFFFFRKVIINIFIKSTN